MEILDTEGSIRSLDQSDMLGVVGRMPEMIEQAERFSVGVSLPKIREINQVVVLGLGGSAIAGDLAADILYKKIKVPVLTNRQYSLPEYVGPESLVFALSYSGETEEVLSAVREAEKRKSQVVCITSGGKLKEIAEAKKYPLFLIPTGYQPRAALPFMLIPLLISLGKMGLTEPAAAEIKETIALLQKLREEYRPAKPVRANAAKQLAKKLVDKTPVIFGAAGTTGAVALRFKTQLNENSKQTVLVNLFPELDHNELVNLAALKRSEHDYFLAVLRDEEDGERVKKRIEITKSLLSRQLGGAHEVVSQGKSRLARIFSLVLFVDYVSVYLALLHGIDPTPVEVITRLKREMTR